VRISNIIAGQLIVVRFSLSTAGDVYCYVNVDGRTFAFIANVLASRAFTVTRTGIVFKTGNTSNGAVDVDYYSRT